MSLKTHYPWTKSPIIISAPMGGFANHALATAVTKAGGIGFIGSVYSMSELTTNLEAASSSVKRTQDGMLPIGVGFLPFAAKLHEAAEVVRKYRPAIVWLFAAMEMEDYKIWTEKMREVSPDSRIWIQTGSVASALELAETCRPDVLCIQGLDAGGHGYEKGAGVVSLVPEVMDALKEECFDIPVVAAGGIVEGRGVAAALALGAQGVVMGTRFLAARETTIPVPAHRETVLETSDGGQSTVRDKVFDELRGPNIWPIAYDGRSIVSRSYTDFKNGVVLEDVRTALKEADEMEDKGFGGLARERRATIWCGTGVGLIRGEMGAAEIVEEVRECARRVIEKLKTVG